MTDRRFRVLIVDDEPLARRGIRARLQAFPDLILVDDCADGQAAVRAIRAHADAGTPIDLVFLDVQMPGLDGFGVVDAVGVESMPVVVFVTAYDEHALRAFEAQALDYLLKPVDADRFRATVGRAVERIRTESDRDLARRLRALVSGLDSVPDAPPFDLRFVVKSSGRVHFVDVEDLRYVQAAGDYVELHTAERTHLLRATMASLERRLDPAAFTRIHRSTIVRTGLVRELRIDAGQAYAVILNDGSVHRVGRSYQSALADRIGGA